MNSKISLFAFALVCHGCAAGGPTSWTRADADAKALARDRYACSQESRVGDTVGTDQDRVFFYGQNKLAQTEANRLFTMCMEAKGWDPAK